MTQISKKSYCVFSVLNWQVFFKTPFSYLPDLRCGCFLCTRMERSSVDPSKKYDSNF